MTSPRLNSESATNAGHLYLIDPFWPRLVRALYEVTWEIVKLYFWLFYAFGTFFLVFFGVIMVLAASIDLAKGHQSILHGITSVAVGLLLIIFRRVRAFIWAFLGCAVLWTIAITAPALWLLGPDVRLTSVAGRAVMLTIYFFPPLLGALLIDRWRKNQAATSGAGVNLTDR